MVLARFQRTIVDDEGNVLPAATVTVRKEIAGAPLAVLYADRAGTVPLGNPFAADGDGFAAFHTAGGAFRITAASGATSIDWRYVPIGLAGESDATSNGTALLFAAATADADPGAGYFRFNNATLASVTAIYIDNSAANEAVISTWLDTFDDGGSTTNRGTITIAQVTGDAFFMGKVTGSVVDGTGYRKLTVTPLATVGTFVADRAADVVFNGTGAPGADGTRSSLIAARTYYVRSDGSNSNTGLVDSAGGAFLTIQKAIDVVYGTLDLAGFDVDIQVRDGTFAPFSAIGPQVGIGMVTVKGNAATPANCVISSAALTSQNGCADARNGAVITVKDLKVTTTVGGSGIVATQNSMMFFSNIDFGAVFEYHILSAKGSVVQASGNYAITGAAQRHMAALSVSELRVQSRTVTITGTPAFSDTFVHAELNGVARINGNTWSGSATGKRFNATSSGVVSATGGLTELPGNAAGTVDLGGMHPALSTQLSFIIAASDETTAITAATNKVKFRMPYAFTLTDVRAGLSTAQASGSIFTVDVNEGGTTILSTKLTIDNTETTSTTAATPRVISDTSLADDAEISIDVDQIGDGTAKGLKVTLIGFRT